MKTRPAIWRRETDRIIHALRLGHCSAGINLSEAPYKRAVEIAEAQQAPVDEVLAAGFEKRLASASASSIHKPFASSISTATGPST